MCPGVDAHHHKAPVGKEQMDFSCCSRSVFHLNKCIKELRHIDPAQGLRDHEHKEKKIQKRLEKSSRIVFPPEYRCGPSSVQNMMRQKQKEHDGSAYFMVSLPNKGVCHLNRQQDRHDAVNDLADVFAFHDAGFIEFDQ